MGCSGVLICFVVLREGLMAAFTLGFAAGAVFVLVLWSLDGS